MPAAKTILYDDNCPLCCWYTSAFVRTGLLTEAGRCSFTNTDLATLPDFDRTRGVDEIPLLDNQGGATLYGIDSLVYLLGQRWPWMKRVARWSVVNWCLRRLYQLISYNRRVIVGKPTPLGAFDCRPNFSYFYRYLYLFLAVLTVAAGVAFYVYDHGLSIALLIPLTLLCATFPNVLKIATAEDRLHYFGIMLTPLFPVGGLLLFAGLLPTSAGVGPVLAGLVGGWMWYRRVRYVKAILSIQT